MTTYSNFAAPIISAAAALALSFMSISNTVSTPAAGAQPALATALATAPATTYTAASQADVA